ncbi:DUF1206 domain-containing protein [Paractinoplanes hotanensis]|uniref:DUF1206 domain-containing protein n=1 Tax=Paractinoplanes hotanensis TaxID=2906497 RepID=A0ABT0XYK9_9ACTN|nr:DUF1206 domain-containing protein [Actinoplanes hotanensis]MCM4078868.1 DUF1206 domain-containing protein [Actinoplanes hotanensis]
MASWRRDLRRQSARSAAEEHDSDKARGLDAALRALSEHSCGMWLLLLAAIGFAAYGSFALAEARYRKV